MGIFCCNCYDSEEQDTKDTTLSVEKGALRVIPPGLRAAPAGHRSKATQGCVMAIFHLSMQPFQRSAGRSSTAAAAYRSGEKIVDLRTGEIFDYRRRRGVVSTDLILPAGVPEMSRSDFWNGVEKKHTRGDAVVAREFEGSLPHELSVSERRRLATDFAREIAEFYKVGVDADIHEPHRKKTETRNHHCHFLISACSVSADGFGKKVAELDPIHCKRHQIETPADYWRQRWADLTNERLAENGIDALVDHRSLADQGIEREPQVHLGPAAMGFEQRTGEESDVRIRAREQVAQLVADAKEKAALDLAVKDARRVAVEAIKERGAAHIALVWAQSQVVKIVAAAKRIIAPDAPVPVVPVVEVASLPGLSQISDSDRRAAFFGHDPLLRPAPDEPAPEVDQDEPEPEAPRS